MPKRPVQCMNRATQIEADQPARRTRAKLRFALGRTTSAGFARQDSVVNVAMELLHSPAEQSAFECQEKFILLVRDSHSLQMEWITAISNRTSDGSNCRQVAALLSNAHGL